MITHKENTLTLQCYDLIQEKIINGTLAPGQKLKVEFLKQMLGVGHSPIREALSRLAASGLVEALDNKGFRVAQISEEDIRDTYRTFFQIEMLALKQAIELGDDAWEASVVAALHHLTLIEIKYETVPYKIWSERNYAFHVALISGCKSPRLMQVRADFFNQFDRYCHMAFNLRRAELTINNDEHKQLADAVLKRDLETTTVLMKHHIFDALEDIILIFKHNEKM